MPRRVISSGSTATRWPKAFRREPPAVCAAGVVLYDDKAFIFPADGKIDAINVKDGTKAFDSGHFDPETGNSPSSGTGLAAEEKSSRVSIVSWEPVASSARSMPKPAREPGGSIRPRNPVNLEATRGTVSRPRSAAAAAAIPGSPAPTTRLFNLTFWGASQAKPWHRKSRGENDGEALLYTDSMLALDVNTGKLAWYHQFIPGESFDIDEHYEFINVDIPGYAQKSGFEMGKAGVLWHLDRETGQLIQCAWTPACRT